MTPSAAGGLQGPGQPAMPTCRGPSCTPPALPLGWEQGGLRPPTSDVFLPVLKTLSFVSKGMQSGGPAWAPPLTGAPLEQRLMFP